MEAKKLYIDGKWVEGSGKKTLDVINPADGSVIAKICEASVEDTKKAIAAAKWRLLAVYWLSMASHMR